LTPRIWRPFLTVQIACAARMGCDTHANQSPCFCLRHPQFSPEGRRSLMGFLWTLIVGLIVGALAKLFMPGKDPGGGIVTMLLGVAGSLVAGFAGRAFGWYHNPGSGPGIIASIIGAMILLGIYRLVMRRTHRTTTTP